VARPEFGRFEGDLCVRVGRDAAPTELTAFWIPNYKDFAPMGHDLALRNAHLQTLETCSVGAKSL